MNLSAIVAVVLFWLGSCAGSVWLGWDYRDAKVAQQKEKAVNDALQKASKQATADMAAAIERTATDAVAAERARKAKASGISDAVGAARSDCVRSVESIRLLNVAIDAANGAKDSTTGVSLKLSRTASPGGWKGLVNSPVGVRND
jgi:hypothetical protein